jgi:hypothetical protein
MGATSPNSLSAASAKYWMQFAAPFTSTARDSRSGLPTSSVSSSASSSLFSRISSANRSITALRLRGCSFDQRPSSNAARADATASVTSSSPHSATSQSTDPSRGLMSENVSPERASRGSPSTKA